MLKNAFIAVGVALALIFMFIFISHLKAVETKKEITIHHYHHIEIQGGSYLSHPVKIEISQKK